MSYHKLNKVKYALSYVNITISYSVLISKSSISEIRHKPTHDSESLNQAVNRAINDQNFLNTSINLLEDLNFPAFKNNIIDHIKKIKDSEVISLFESLDGYILYRDQYHVQNALEVNDPKKKEENQITDETRNDPSSTGRTIDSKKDTVVQASTTG